MARERNTERRLGDRSEESGEHYSFLRYGSYEEMQTWMRSLAKRNPQTVRFISIGRSHEGRSIDGVEVEQ